MQKNQRVHTKFGAGTVAGFERITHVALPTSRHDTYQEGDRVEVALDDPTQWAARGCNPYFYADEINQLTKE